jgi:apolipoprotein N-acyltransferase
LEGTNYVIWPESAFPFLLTERRDVLSMIGEMLPEGTQLITGAMRAEPNAAGNIYGKVYNSVFVIDETGEIIEAADKTHLVPFGEYLPFQETLEAIGLRQLTQLRGGFEAGAERKLLLQQSEFPLLALICYEIIFSGSLFDQEDDLLEGGESSPKWIVNLTNDGWFGFTPGPYQHLRQSVLRAVEEGIPVIRVANTGISAVIDPYGRILMRTRLGMEAVIDSKLPRSSVPTIFTQFRHLGFYIILGLFFILALLTRRRAIIS